VSNLSLVFLLIIFLALSAFFSAGETALFGLPRLRLRRLARQGAGAGLFKQVLEAPHRVLVGILLGNTLANVAATAVTALLLFRLAGERLTLAGLVAVQVLAVSFVEFSTGFRSDLGRLGELCAEELGSASRWREVATLNGWTEDEVTRLPPNTAVKLPPH